MGALQENEVITLTVALLLLPVVLISVKRIDLTPRRYIIATYLALLVAQFATNIEAIVLPGVLNVVEHASTTIAAVLFALFVRAFTSSVSEEGRGV